MTQEQYSLLKRREIIKQLRDSGIEDYQTKLTFQARDITLGVYTVDIGFPCYRLSNGRTLAAQREVVALKSYPSDFFTIDPDSEAALREQDAILRTMVRQAGLLSILRKQKQTQPLILDNDGYLVNGNRRICAMRLLLEENESSFSHFKHVQVVILPPASERDIKELEGRLQVLPEGRADYSWVDEAMLYRELIQKGWTEDEITRLYDKKLKEVRDRIAMLEDAEQYLASRSKDGCYSQVLKQEYAFLQLQKNRPKCGNDEGKKQFFTALSYLMLDEPDDAKGRLYDSIPDALKSIERIEEAMTRELKITPAVSSDEDPLAALGGTGDNPFAGVTAAAQDMSNAGAVRDIIRDTIEQARAEERERKDAQYCSRQIQQAYTKLESALSAFDQDTDTTGILELLKSIEGAVNDLYEHVNNVSD